MKSGIESGSGNPGAELGALSVAISAGQPPGVAVGTKDAVREPAVSRSPWAPTLSDSLFLSLIVWLFLAGPNGWLALLSDGDTGWHIRVGDWIREFRDVPRQDFLSFSRAGEPWFAWEWAAELWMSFLHTWAGLKGVVLGLGVMIPAYLLVVFRHAIWRNSAPLIALPLLLIASGSSAIHYLARPHLFTLLFLSGSLWLLEKDRRSPSRSVWLLVPATVVWTNLHGGFLSLVACLGLIAAGELLAGRWSAARRYGLLAGFCMAASLVNPYGYRLHEHTLTYLRSDWIREAVDEFQSPSFRSEAMLMFEVLLFLSLVVSYRAIRRREWVDALLVIAWAHFSLASVRHVPIFLLVSIPILAAELSAWWREIAPSLPRRSVLRTFDALSRDLTPGFVRNSAWVVVPVILLCVLDKPIAWPRNFPDEKFPTATIETHKAAIEGKRVLTTDEWGDYLAYRFYPRQRVFFDGRSDFYGEKLGRIYLSLMQGGADAEAQVERFQFDVVMVPPEWRIQSALRRSRNWELLADEKRVVLLRRRAAPASAGF